MKKEKIKFGFGQIGNHTPQISTWFFRIIFYACSLITLALTTLNLSVFGLNVTQELSNELIKLMSVVVMASHTLSRMVGVEVKKEDYEIN